MRKGTGAFPHSDRDRILGTGADNGFASTPWPVNWFNELIKWTKICRFPMAFARAFTWAKMLIFVNVISRDCVPLCAQIKCLEYVWTGADVPQNGDENNLFYQ